MKQIGVLCFLLASVCNAQTIEDLDGEFGFQGIKIGTSIHDYQGFYNPTAEAIKRTGKALDLTFKGAESIYYPPDEKQFKIEDFPVQVKLIVDDLKNIKDIEVTFKGYWN